MRKPLPKLRVRMISSLALLTGLLLSISFVAAAKVKEVVVRFDDGSEQTVAANAAPLPATDPQPVPQPQPAPDPLPPPDPQPLPDPAPSSTPPVAGPLAVQLVDPADATVTCAPGFLLLRANVVGDAAKVEFFQGDTLIGTSVARPHMIPWRDIPKGDYIITAKATDATGTSVVSPPSHVAVKDPPTGKTFTAVASGDIGRLTAQLSPGDTLLIKAGTYNDSIKLSRSGTADKPIYIRAEEPGQVTVRAAAPGPLFNGDAADYMVVSGITFIGGGADKQDNDKAAVRVGSYCRVEDCVVQNALGVGLTMKGSASVFLRDTAQDNARAGMGGTSNKGAMVLDCISRRNNAKGDSNGGGGKFTRSDGVLIQNHQSYENTGVGIWFDYSNIDCVVRHCEVHHNVDRMKNGKLKSGAAGIFFEISGIVEKSGKEGYFLAEDNYVHDNDREGIQAWGSRNVIIRDNTLVNDSIELRAGRPEPFELKNVTVTGNRLKDTSIGLDGDAAKQFATSQIRIDANIYDRSGGAIVRWSNANYTDLPSARQALGIEEHGSAGTIDTSDWSIPK